MATVMVVTAMSLNIIIAGLTVLVAIVSSLAAALVTLTFYIVLTVISVYASYHFIKNMVSKG